MPCFKIVAIFYNILQNESLKKIKYLKLRTHGSITNSLIFMRRYEVMDFPAFLTIFYKIETSVKIKYLTASRHKLAAVISWPPSPTLEIATNLKADCNCKWSIIIRCTHFIVLNTTERLICLLGPIKVEAANL